MVIETEIELTGKTHELKILPKYFKDVESGLKCFELRKNDRRFSVGDRIILKEWDGEKFTGKSIIYIIKYVLKDCPEYGLMDGYCIIGF